MDKLTNGTVIIELQSPVTFSDLNALSRRDLVVTLESKQSNFKLQGVVVPRAYCELYQTLVVSNGHQADSKKDRCVILRRVQRIYRLDFGFCTHPAEAPYIVKPVDVSRFP